MRGFAGVEALRVTADSPGAGVSTQQEQEEDDDEYAP
jgi:hypothetical protein